MSKMPTDPFTGFIAGGLAGGIAAVATSPLEVIKTRLQSNVGREVVQVCRLVSQQTFSLASPGTIYPPHTTSAISLGSLNYVRHIVKTEGGQALFKGLLPTLIGSVPTRAVYFSMYSRFKLFYNNHLTPNSSGVHLLSAMSAGVVTSTTTSPIWVVKTQMQLHNRPHQLLTVRNCIRSLYRTDGIRAFYRGLTASYAGTIETAIHFVIYERMKVKVAQLSGKREPHPTECMFIAAGSKMTASMLCYPHEVCRTRLRQEAKPSERVYHSFLQTLTKIGREEGRRGLYGGLTAHLVRVVPNTAIIFFSYEAIVRIMQRWQELSY